ncbi:MAG: hypothetical protein V2A64_02490 [Candidatus Omnitrophota bacterium]
MLTPDLKSVNITVSDKQDNITNTNAAIDFFLKPVIVMVNEKEIKLDKEGFFSTEIIPQADMQQIIISAKDSAGNEATPVKLAIADIIPPTLILGDLAYSRDSVEINGKTDPYAIVTDKSGRLFSDKISTDSNGIFKIKIKRPEQMLTGALIAEDASGNHSQEVNVTIEPLIDNYPPRLTVANLEYKGNKVTVSGSSEDDTGIKSVTINGQAVELQNNIFSVELDLTPGLTKVEVTATDLSGKTTTVLKIIEDNIKPGITLEDLSYDNGYCLVKGSAADNIGLKEVRVNNIPVPLNLPEGGNFEYPLPITAELKEITAAAVDLYGNFTETPPKTITLPADNIPPILTLNELTYGSPIVIVSGVVKDNVGIKQVLVNGLPVNLYEDGSFKTQIAINFSAPALSLNDPIYDNGMVTLSGRVNPGIQDPREIIAQAEDLNGNKSEVIKKQPQPFQLEDIKVLVNDQLADLENGSFSTRIAIEKGMTGITVSAIDPFGNAAQEQTLPLEKVPPIIEVNEPRYADNNVTISGTAKDTGAGIAEVLINAASVPVGNDGKFSQTFTVNESSITIVAIDRLGNMATAPPIKLTPADKAVPVFILKVTPMPAIIGKSVFIGIDALDSKTRLPEILSNPPEVKVTLPNAQSLTLTVNGQGASFNAALDTTGLTPGSINISIKGTDSNGNTGDKIEGISTFLLNTQDNIPPTLKITLTPPPPVIAGTNVQIMLTTSETLKTLPKTEISLPGGTKFELNLEGSLSGTLFSKNISLPQDLPPGDAIITASGAVDLAGNTQTASEEFRFFVRPQTTGPAGGLILRLEAPEITSSKIYLKGITAPGAIVHLNAANMQADIPADDNGRFNFMRQVSPADLDNWPRLYPDGFIPVNCFSTNYAGLKSEIINLKFPLPKITAEVRGALVIEAQPDPVEQGKPINILIKTDTPLNQPPRAVIKFIDGRAEPLSLTGAGKEFSAVYPITMAARPGPAIIEVRTEKFFQARPFMIIPFGPAMMAGGFYNISANPDPAIIGKDAEFFVRPQRPIDKPPRLQIRLPNGRMDNIALAGEGLEFKGKYLCPANMPPGPAELIINDGEYRRPYGISSQPSFGPEGARMFSGLIAYSNPSPMLAGAAATITVKSDQYLNFMPKADLRLTNGRLITTGLSGTVPGNNFSGQVNLPMDAPYGPATIVLRNERNEIIGEHPANIAPAYAPQAGKEVDVIMSPFSSMPGQSVNITVTSRRGPFTTMPQAKLIFNNSLVFPLRLEGNLPTAALTSTANIPPSAAPGPVSINVIDENGRPIGNGQGMIGTAGMGPGAGIPHGEININLMPPYIMPGNNFEIQVYSPSSLYLLPKVSLDIPGKGTKDLRVDGQVPGNSFRSQSIFPRDAKVRGSRIDLRFDRGTGEETRSIFLEGGGEEERRDFRPPQLQPWPPIPGQPLMLTLYAPEQIDFVPIVRVNYYNGQNEPIPLSGPIPGDTFSGTLGRVIMPLRSLDIFDPKDNRLLVSLPIEMFGGYTGATTLAPPILEITPAQPLMPPVITNIAIRFSQPAPMIPRVNVQLPDGRNINVFVNGAVPGTFFNGMLQIPPDCPSGQAGIQVYLGDQPIPGMPPIMIGGAAFNPGDILNLKAFPNGPVGELAVDWLIMPNAMKHRLSYQAPGVPGGTKDLGRIGHYILTGLRTGIDYQIMLTAYDQGGREFANSKLDGIRLPETNRTMDGFPADASNAGPNSLQINWEPQFNATSYELHYALSPADPMTGQTRPLGSTASYILSGLANGTYRIIIEAVFAAGERKKSREAVGSLGGFDIGGGTININPDPPIIGQVLNVSCTTNNPQTLQPYARFYFTADRPTEDRLMTGPANGTVFNYSYSSLPTALMRIEIWDNAKLTRIAERPLGTMAPMPGTMGCWMLNVTPPNPAPGQPYTINLNNTCGQNISAFPYTRVFTASGNSKEYKLNGSLPGANFNWTVPLPDANETPMRIEGWDNPKTTKLCPDYFVSAAPMPGSGGTLMVDPPCPRKGNTANVFASTNRLQPIQPYARFFFVDRPYQDMLMFGPAGGRAFNYTYANLPADVVQVELWDNYKTIMITEFRSACGAGTGNLKANISTTPDPPIIGTYTAISVNIVDMNSGQPANISTYPQIYADFMNGRLPLPARGSLPGSTFNEEILAVNFTSQLHSITVEHNGSIIGQRPFGSAPAPEPGSLGFSCNNPYAGQEVRCMADVPLSQPAITAYPQMRVFYPAGTSPLDELMAVTGNLPGWHFEGVVNQAKNRPDRAELKLTNGLIQTFYFAPPINNPPVPFDPLCPTTLGQPFNYCMTFPAPQPAPPYIRINFKDNSPAPWERIMAGSGTYFCVNTEPLPNYVDKFELLDNGGNKLAEKSCGVVANDCWNINVSPDPPRINESCSVSLNNPCGRQLSMVPNLRVTFSTGNKDYPMNGGLPGTNFTYTIPAGDMTTSVTRMEGFENNRTTKLPGADRTWSAQGGCPDQYALTMEIRPMPYYAGQSTTLAFDLPLSQPYISTRPTAKVYYNTQGSETVNLSSGVLPGWHFEGSFIPKENFLNVEIDIPGCWTKNFPATPPSTDYPRNPWDRHPGMCSEREIHWDTVPGATGYDIYCQQSTIPITPTQKWTEVFGGNIASVTITGLSCSQNYYYHVTVRGGTAHIDPKSFFTETFTPGSQTLEITDPANGDVYFGDVSRGSNSASINITIKNNKTTTAQIKKQSGSGQLRNSPTVYFSETDTHFSNFTIQPGNSGSTSIYISVPSTATSGTYGTNLILYDDANGNNIWDSGETIVKTTGYLDIQLALRVQGELNITPPTVLWGSVSTGSTTSLQNFYAGNPTGADLVDIKVEKQPLYLQGGGSTIDGNNINVNLGLSIVSGKVVLGSGQTSNSTISVSVPSTTMIGTYHGNLRIYHDANNNGTYDGSSEPSGTLALEVSVASPSGGGAVHHFTLSTVPGGTTTSPVGKPVLIKVTAYTSTDDTTIATSFSNSVTMSVSGSNYILSLQDRVTKISSQLQISAGIGYCTIDAVSAASLGISVSGYTSNTLSISFTTPTCSDLTVKQLAVDFERETVIGGTSAIQVFTVTDYGKMAANYTGTINFIFTDSGAPSLTLTKTLGEGTLSASAPYTYNFVSTDYGNASFELKDTEGETIPFSITDTGNSLSASGTIRFTGVEKFIVEPATRVVQGNNIQLTVWAATNGERKLSGYNNSSVSVTKISETGGQTANSAYVPATIAFSNGSATFTVSEPSNEYETVRLEIKDGTITSGSIDVRFASTDTNPPSIDNVIAETPFLIHLYFSEDIDSENALIKDNYTGVGTINKVCWYEDEVTLHLASALTLGAPLINITVYGTEPNGIKDNDGNYMGNATKPFTVPSVDYQGSSYGSGDWLEIQAAPAQISTGSQTIKVTIIQKNACGYLTGSNAVNKSTTVSNVNLTYTNTQFITGLVSSQTMSDGKCEFNLTTNFTAAGQTISVTAAAGGVTSGTATVTSQ